eukprot:CAMPEP_0171330796 /NCGR_PEP_ID=MMETSP0878-20121228/2248_1 /TAXON_ID=67004 /ORGANISM="Thalassiosira weissflogii, Strain CCMP1336" /LENGTH=448 /DNA_ID=CAMNT_0011831171 /DNA_START=267 /DNA_END=1613 /DNA_ORIENTATION=-
MDTITNPPKSPMDYDDYEHDPISDEQGTPAQNMFFHSLHTMINNEASTGCVEWLPDNKGFIINQKKFFSNTVLPEYFGRAKYTSFTRRLKRWGFKRISNGPHAGAYYHDRFHRGMDFDMYDPADIGWESASSQPAYFGMSDINSPTLGQKHVLPPKKRAPSKKWNPENDVPSIPQVPAWCNISNVESQSLSRANANKREASYGAQSNDDVHAIPEIMRRIDRLKRKESNMDDFVDRPAKKIASYPYPTNTTVISNEAFSPTTSRRQYSKTDELARCNFGKSTRSPCAGFGLSYTPDFAQRQSMQQRRQDFEPSSFTRGSFPRPPLLSTDFHNRPSSIDNNCYSQRDFHWAPMTPSVNHFNYQPEPSIADVDRMRSTWSFSRRPQIMESGFCMARDSFAVKTNNKLDDESADRAAAYAAFCQLKRDEEQYRVPIPDPQKPKSFPYNRAA